MRILFIAPLPPPVNGHSVVSQRLLEHLRTAHEVTVVDLRKRSLKDGVDSFARVVEVLGILRRVFESRKCAEVVYLTISESLAGNLKDLIVCLLCQRRRSRMFVHLHGGSLKAELFDRHKSIHWINKRVFGRLSGAIVSGSSHLAIFDGILDRSKVHVAANFAGDDMFVTERQVVEKFASLAPIRILYISHMTEKKGYRRLTEASRRASEAVRRAIRIDFAGAFENEDDKRRFLEDIKDEPRIRYHGVVSDDTKRALFQGAHLFCLPTAFLEGQPISILEAYAAGCVVVATGQPGIRDVFSHGVNGYELAGTTSEEIGRTLARVVEEREGLLEIALRNRRLADEKYRVSASVERISGILDGVVCS